MKTRLVVRFCSRTAAAAVLGGLAVLVAGCGGADGGSASGDAAAITVVATTTQLADFAREVGGDRVDVVQLLQPNSDPHDYEPRPQDIQKAAEAELMLVSGDGLDEWAADVAEQAGIAEDAAIDVGAARPVEAGGGHSQEDETRADEREGEHSEEDEPHGETDPHWWHDPRNARSAVATIRDALVQADADGASGYRANATRYAGEIAALDTQLAGCFSAVPEARRKLVSDHDALSYLTDRYDIEFVGAIIPSSTSQAQPSAGELSELVGTVRSEDVAAIFPESSLDDGLARTIAQRTGARVGGTLYADTLGPEGDAAGTYLGSMRANAAALVEGFTGGEQTCG